MDRREEILDAAARLLAHYGVRKTSVADIAREVGIGTGSVYLEFPSKEAIVHGLAERAHDRMLEQLRKVLNTDEPVAVRVVRFFQARTELYRGACLAGEHALDLLRCTGKSSSPWFDFLVEQRALLEVTLGDPQLARGVFLAYTAFTPPRPELRDDAALRAVHEVIRRALN